MVVLCSETLTVDDFFTGFTRGEVGQFYRALDNYFNQQLFLHSSRRGIIKSMIGERVDYHEIRSPNFGDYSVDLFRNAQMHGDPPSRALFDMVAVAIVKNPAWGERKEIPAPILVDEKWQERPDNPMKVAIWENFESQLILDDFYATMMNPVIVN